MNEIIKKLDKFKYPPSEFTFNAEHHKYHYNNIELTSVTTFISNFHKEFDTEYWADYKSKELNIPIELIKEDWENKKNLGLTVGSIVHEWIEDFLNKKNPKVPKIDYNIGDYSINEINHLIDLRIKKWQKIYFDKLIKMIPITQELRIWSLKYKLAGTIDTLFWYKNNLIVGDWKTNKDFKTDDDYCYDMLKYPFNDQLDNSLNRYSIQVSLYKLILQEHGIQTGPSFICWIPRDETEAKFFKAKDYTNILQNYLNKLKNNIL
jgi:ATP-dependent exoDNAse (exonuclease V) beta subunit